MLGGTVCGPAPSSSRGVPRETRQKGVSRLTKTLRRVGLLALLLATALTLAACRWIGSGGDMQGMDHGDGSGGGAQGEPQASA